KCQRGSESGDGSRPHHTWAHPSGSSFAIPQASGVTVEISREAVRLRGFLSKTLLLETTPGRKVFPARPGSHFLLSHISRRLKAEAGAVAFFVTFQSQFDQTG